MPTSFQTQRSIARNLVLSALSQETIGETFADASLTYRGRPETSAFAQWDGSYESDYEYAGKGNSMATESRLITQQSSLSLSTRLDDFLVGFLFAFCMAQETYTVGAEGAPNTHLFTWKDTGDPALLTNVYIEDTSALKRKWADLSLSQFVLSGSDKGSVMVKASFIGLGTFTAVAMGALPALPTAQYLYGSDSVVSIGPVGAPVSLSPRVLSWEATFDHQNELFRATGGGTKPYFVRQGNPIQKLKLVIANDTTSDVETWRINQTPLEVKIVVASGATSLTIDYPNVNIPKADIGEQDKLVASTIELDQTTIKQPAGGGNAVTATVLNTDVAYLTGV
jgi:hypothetical protein